MYNIAGILDSQTFPLLFFESTQVCDEGGGLVETMLVVMRVNKMN
jgi:hypothetical protein